MPHCLEISIHGARDETAEALTQVKGSFTRQMRALELLSERDIRVFLKCVVTRLVENELEEIQAIGARFGYPVYFDPVLTISDDRQLYPLELRASDEGIARMYRTSGLNLGNSPFQREPGEFNCTVGTGTVHVNPYGYVLPCVQWKQPVGNIREKSLREIWETSPLLLAAREANRKSLQALKDSVEEHAFCAHCPGSVVAEVGRPTAPRRAVRADRQDPFRPRKAAVMTANRSRAVIGRHADDRSRSPGRP